MYSSESLLHFCSTPEVFDKEVVWRILIVLLSLGGFFFAFDFVYVGCLVVGFFALLTRVLQSPIGFWGWNCTWGFGMHLSLGVSQ